VAGANRFEDLLSWQRMHELNIEVWKATEHGPVARDFDFRNEIRDAADSAERNIAEGFGRFNPPVFANFLDFSRASGLETKSLLKKGRAVGYFKADEAARLDSLADRGIQAVAKFQRYLRSPEAKRNATRRYRRKWAPKRENGPIAPNAPNAPNEPNDLNEPNASNEPNAPNVPNEPND
jgi:four helix bundle protein